MQEVEGPASYLGRFLLVRAAASGICRHSQLGAMGMWGRRTGEPHWENPGRFGGEEPLHACGASKGPISPVETRCLRSFGVDTWRRLVLFISKVYWN